MRAFVVHPTCYAADMLNGHRGCWRRNIPKAVVHSIDSPITEAWQEAGCQ